MGLMSRETWHQRFEEARADLLDAARVLEVRDCLAAASGPCVFGDREALGQATRVGVFSGSFNPQTVAHAVVSEAARASQRLDMVIWAMARVTVDKEGVTRATLADRVVQVRAYIRATAPQDVVAVIEAGLYAEQAEAIRSLVGRDCEVWLIAGFDKIVQILDAKYYTDRGAILGRLFANARLLVAPRASQGASDLATVLAEPENRPFASKIALLATRLDVATIASTQARQLMQEDVLPEALSALVTPEGAALGLATAAYRGLERLSDGTTVDRYAERNRKLDALTQGRGRSGDR